MFDPNDLFGGEGSRIEFIEGLKSRTLDQKYLYLGSGAGVYYASVDAAKKTNINSFIPNSYFPDFIRPILKFDEINVIVSLGCGNATSEASAIEVLLGEGYKFAYFGVDSSETMLDLAKKTFAPIMDRVESHFLCADIMTQDFRVEILRLTGKYPRRIFSFLGSTFGNFNQTNITDSLYNILEAGDCLWFDVVARSGLTAIEDLKLFNRYSAYLKNEETSRFIFRSLGSAGVPFENGSMQLASDQEVSIGAISFRFSFVVKERTILKLKNDIVHLLPGETVQVLTVRAYHTETLVRFFLGHNFELIRNQVDSFPNGVTRSQFLFQKKS